MRLVSGARYADLQTRYQRVAEAREAAETVAAERLSTITRQAEELTRLRDSHPTTPVREPQRVTGDAELRQQLHLARRAIAELSKQLTVLQAAHEADTRELLDLRQGVTS